MARHKFKIGEQVVFHSPRSFVGPSIYTILRLMPVEGRDVTYRIKAPEGGIERVAKETELTGLMEGTA